MYELWPHWQQRRLAARVNKNPSAAQVHQQQCGGLTTVGCPSAGGLTTARAEWTAVALGGGTGCTRRSRVRRHLIRSLGGGAVAMLAAVRGHVLRLYVRGHGLLAAATACTREWLWAVSLCRSGRRSRPWAPGFGYGQQPCAAMGCGCAGPTGRSCGYATVRGHGLQLCVTMGFSRSGGEASVGCSRMLHLCGAVQGHGRLLCRPWL